MSEFAKTKHAYVQMYTNLFVNYKVAYEVERLEYGYQFNARQKLLNIGFTG